MSDETESLIEPQSDSHTIMSQFGLEIQKLGGKEVSFPIPGNFVLHVRDICNIWIKQFGAFDTQGREVIGESELR